jgi:hypothetical protein
MSKVKIQGNASGTGVVTLTAPNTNTDRTITLPDSTGSILDSTSTLDATKLSGALPAIDGSALTGVGGAAGSAAFAAGCTTQGWLALAAGAIAPFNNDSSGDRFDTDSVYDTATYKFTAPATGVYTFWYSVYTANTDTANGFGFLKNSSRLLLSVRSEGILSYGEGGDNHTQEASVIIPLSSGDTIAVITTAASDFYEGHSQWGGCRLA